jgi:Arc/MetJ-type ribon-helix-helix transcriptional regulator
MTVRVDLSPELERLAKALVDSGRYASLEEVVAAALEELALQELTGAGATVARSDADLAQLVAEADAEADWRDAEGVFARLRARIEASA